MTGFPARVNTPIATSELERRWTAVRKSMEAAGIDVLFMQNNNDHLGGYVKYFTDTPAAGGYPVVVIFPRDKGMTFISQGNFGLDKKTDPSDNGSRGIARIMGAPGYHSAHYTARYEAEMVQTAMQEYAGATIGFVGTGALSYVVVDALKKSLPTAKFVDASDLVDRIKMSKSDYELEMIRKTATMQDESMREVFSNIQPGMKDMEVTALAQQIGHGHGSEQGVYLTGSGQPGTMAIFGAWHYQAKTIAPGDYISLLIENNGAGGMYTELGRMAIFGRASDEMKQEVAFARKAQDFTASLLKPGAKPKDVWDAYNQFLTDNKKPVETRLFCHGQGYDLVERPLIRFDEPFDLEERMSIACHPSLATAKGFTFLCDNFVIGKNGAERIHHCDWEIFELN